MTGREIARSVVALTERTARATTAHRRVKMVSSSAGRHVVEYRGQQITLSSNWRGSHIAGTWFNAAFVDGALQIVHPSAYGGSVA